MPEFLVISSGELCLFFFFAWLFRITSGSGCETCTMPKTHALKITHAWQDHVHFPEFEFVKIWRNLSAAKRETPLLNVLQPPQKRHYNDWSFLVSLSLKKRCLFISRIGQLIQIVLTFTCTCLFSKKNKIIFYL